MMKLNTLARSTIRRASRSMATEAATPTAGKLLVNFTSPFRAFTSKKFISQVNLSTTDGDVGILAGHVPTVMELLPSVVSLVDALGATERYFVSGGFAVVNPDSSLNINAVEACVIEDLDLEAAKQHLALAQKESTPESAVQVKVYEAILFAAKA